MSEKTKTIPIAEAQAAQLRQFAEVSLGLEIPSLSNVAQIVAKMRAAGFTADAIEIEAEVDDDPTGAEPHRPQREGKLAELSKEELNDLVMVKIGTQEGPGGTEHVPLGVNGRTIAVARDTWVAIPRSYVEVLENAKHTVYTQAPDATGKGVGGDLIGREVHLYPFQTMSVEKAA